MEDEKVVSIEERIPKLKEARRKKTNRRLIFYLCLFFVLISIVVYLQSPLSYVSEINVAGQEYVSIEEIIEYSRLSNDDNIWGFRTSDIEDNIKELPEIKDAEVRRILPNHIKITVDELDKVAYLNEGRYVYPLLENGKTLESFRITDWQGDAPLLFNFNDQEYLTMLTEQLVQLPSFIVSHISEIYWEPSDTNPFILRMFMTDGFEVVTSIRNFSANMSSYPSIVSQLDDVGDGIIEIGEGGAVFNTYESMKDNEVDEEDENDDDEG
ncbi:cell division protein FtsQ/DivIB [Amphibacillus jilinensis]|uniref:cell division protein FtsQ/DivIB n=1 Tax=Amphibacillus jilinensis TaxID=1216008 RepID=UPI0003160291|nr:FtsQ-type POTRA domain-containing protein [Amphibacillus jilinensis]